MATTASAGLKERIGSPQRAVILATAIWAFASFDHSLFGYAIPGIMAEFGLGVSEIGLILSASFLFAAFSTIAVGATADIVGHRLAMVLCLAGSAVLIAAMGAAGSVMILVILRMLGFGMGNALSPLTGAYVAGQISPSRRPLAIGVLQCGYPIGWCLASLAVAPMLHLHGWRTVFLCALPIAALAPLLYRFLPPSETKRARSQGSLGSRFAVLYGSDLRRPAALVAIGFFCFAGAYAGSAFFMPTFLQQVRGYTPEMATLLTGSAYGVGILGYLAAALVGQYLLSRRHTAMIWCLCGAISFVAFTWLPRAPWQDFLLFGVSAFFFYGTSAVLFVVATEVFPAEIRATGIALSASVGVNLGFALFPSVVGGMVESLGWQVALTASVAPLLVIAIGALAMLGESEREGGTIDGSA